MTLLTGPKLEKYDVIRELGRGGMGVVYLAEDRQLSRQVALKVLYEHLYRETSFVSRFREEARSVSTLHHPNIVYVHGLEQADGLLAIDMEYVAGYSLDQRRDGARVSPHAAVAIARDVLNGLATCHQIGVIHRDIKPSNILIQEGGTAKVTDFGLATAYACHLEDTVQASTSTGFYMGTPRYMPVEAWEGDIPKPGWDTYALGVVLFELLSGEVAFPGDSPLAIMRKHLAGPLPSIGDRVEGLSNELVQFVDRLVDERDGLPLSGGEALRLLQELPEYEALHDSDTASTIQVPRQKRRRKPRSYRFRPRVAVPALIFLGVISLALAIQGLWPADRPGDSPSTQRSLESGETFFSVRELGAEEAQTYLVMPDPASGSLVLVGYSGTGLTRLTGEPTGRNDWSLSGGWAEYVTPQSGSMQFGRVEGDLHWGEANNVTMSMRRVRERDNERTEVTLVGQAVQDTMTRETYLRAFEEEVLVQSLLYVELLPRKNLGWAAAIEAMLPATPGARYLIPWAEGEVSADGDLSEPLWTQQYFQEGSGEIGEYAPVHRKVEASLKIRWNEASVLLGAHVESAAPDLRWEVIIQPDFEISIEESERLMVSAGAGSDARFRSYLGREARPAAFTWPAGTAASTGAHTLEMAIPGELLSQFPRAGVEERWRINVQCYSEQADGTRERIAVWGDPDVLRVEHGALLVFQNR